LVAVLASTDGDRKPAGEPPVPTDRIQRWLYQGRRQQRRLLPKHRTTAALVGIAVTALLIILGLTVYGSTRDRAVVLPETPPRPPAVTLTSTIGPSLDPSADASGTAGSETAPPAPPTGPAATPTGVPAPRPAPPAPTRPPPRRVTIPTTFFEAESAANTLTGTARTHSEQNASGGLTIGNLGRGNANALRFNGLTVPQAGTYTLTVFYISGDENRNAVISVNGSGSTVLFPSTGDWDTIGSLTTRINLRAGANSVTFTNAAGPAPDIDQIRLSN
jgi:hypothetical protein